MDEEYIQTKILISKLLKLHSKTAVEEGFDLFSFIHKTQIFWINEFGEGRGGGWIY